MLAAQRHHEILRMIQTQGSIRTIDLARLLDVTDETIRRDLERLEKDGSIQRTHGGAIHRSLEVRDRSFEERSVQHMPAKAAIAKEAVKLIQPGERIFIDASSTAFQMAKLLGAVEVTVITNSELVISLLKNIPSVEIISTGGRYDRNTHSFIGPASVETIRRHRIDKIFFSGNGIDLVRGISEINESQAYIKEVAIPRAGAVIYLADQSKLGVTANYIFARCEHLDMLITERPADHPLIEELMNAGLDVRLAD